MPEYGAQLNTQSNYARYRPRLFLRRWGSPVPVTVRESHKDHSSLGHFRSLSWRVSQSWSATRRLQAIGNNLAALGSSEIVATSGLTVTVFTLNSVLLFAMRALASAILCQDRGLQAYFSIPRQFTWAAPVLSPHSKILEESKNRDRRNACGSLKEIIQNLARCRRLVWGLMLWLGLGGRRRWQPDWGSVKALSRQPV
ncbi:hypothetical protein U1Q18_006821 [Sarracenia purpurea var. burkii]